MSMQDESIVLSLPTSRRFSHFSPLRYPGGKASMTGFFALLIDELGLRKPVYVEPYAGGTGAGIALLLQDRIDSLVINDLDAAVYSFWYSILQETDAFVTLIESTPVTVDEWYRQKAVYTRCDFSHKLELGFAFFYLNRTNRSGILRAGVIGGKSQTGTYRMDARYNRVELIQRIKNIAVLKDRVVLHHMDGKRIVRQYASKDNVFMYIDPPYVQAGESLYLNSFTYRDHYDLSELLHASTQAHWLLTYDNASEIHQLHDDIETFEYRLQYSACSARKETELLIASSTVREFLARFQETVSNSL